MSNRLESRRVVLSTVDADGAHLTVTRVTTRIPHRDPAVVWLVHRDMRFVRSYPHRPTATELFGTDVTT